MLSMYDNAVPLSELKEDVRFLMLIKVCLLLVSVKC